jgi:hypothetical protein
LLDTLPWVSGLTAGDAAPNPTKNLPDWSLGITELQDHQGNQSTYRMATLTDKNHRKIMEFELSFGLGRARNFP